MNAVAMMFRDLAARCLIQAVVAASVGLGSMGMTALAAAPASTAAKPFALPRFDGAGEVKLADLTGKVVVLDFFAYWCLPCQKASGEITAGIERYYAARQGNPGGVEVRVLAVNVEANQRAKTEAFIRRNQLVTVVNDKDGATLAAYGGKNLPFVVVIDGTGGTADKPDFKVVYRREGFEGTEKLRAIIDRLGGGKGAASAPADGQGTVGIEPHPRAQSEVTGRRFILSAAATGDVGSEPTFDEDLRGRLADWLDHGRLPLFASLGEPVMATGIGIQEATSDVDEVAIAPPESAEKETAGATEALADESVGAVVVHQPSAAWEGVFATDVQLTQGSFGYGLRAPAWEGNLTVGYATIGMDYLPVPFDFLGTPLRLDEARGFVQASGRWRIHPRVSLTGGGGYYDGFTDYRSVWLSEYYRQQFSGLPEYLAPSPAGHNLSAGVRFEYLPATGFVQFDYSYLSDEIAPGYEIDFDGLRRGRPSLYTSTFRVSFENVVHRRVRLLHELRSSDTSGRSTRYGYQGSANLALGERWVIRLLGGLASEEPTFDAWHGGATVEYELSPAWLLSAGGRYYEDTGEIENSNFSNAAPPLRAWQMGLGFRYVREHWSVKLFAAPYATRYGAFGIGTAFFQNLYRDRDWGLVEAAFAAEF